MNARYIEIIFTSSATSIAAAAIIYVVYKYVYYNDTFTNMSAETLNNYIQRHHENNHQNDSQQFA